MFNLTTDEKQFEFDFEMALLDIKSERYEEAETKLSTVARNIKSENAYLGIGISKLGKYVRGEADLSEVFFCFTKAISLSNNKDEKLVIISEFILHVTSEMIELIIRKAYEFKQAEKKEFLSQLTLAGSIIVNPLIKENNNLQSLNVGAGIFSILNLSEEKKNKMMSAIKGKLLTLKVEELKKSSIEFLHEYSDNQSLFINSFEKLEECAFNATASSEQKQIDRKDKQIKNLDPSDSYFIFKDRALECYENRNYLATLENIKEAILKVPDDTSLIELRKKCISELATKYSMPLLYVAYMFLGLLILEFFDMVNGNSIIEKEYSPFVMGALMFIAIVIMIFGIIKTMNSKKKLNAIY